MKKIVVLIFILASLQSFGQGVRTKPVYITAFIDGEFKTLQVISTPPIGGYTKINARYEWTAGYFDTALHAPQYNGVPSGLRSGSATASGAIAVDTSNHRLYFYSGGSWRYSTASTGGGTPTWQQTLTAGNTASSNLVLDNTTSSSTAVIYKSSNPFLHNFKPSGSVGRNTFLGELAGNFTMTSSGSTSSNITAIGYNAAHGNTTGFDYVSIGVNNLVSITEGGDHTSVGNYALDACTTCTGFSVLGYSAFGSNVSGADGSAVGYDAFRNSTGSRNSGIGVDVFNDLVSGNNNFGGGFNAGDGITGGSGNTILGTATFTSGTYDSLVVLANGFNQKRLYINGNGAWSLDGGSTYGTSGYFLTTTGSGGLPVYSNTLPSGTTIPISSLTAATETNSINNSNYQQSWNWNSFTGGGAGLDIAASSTVTTGDGGLLHVNVSGANGTSSVTSTAVEIQNEHTGTSSTNVGINVSASGGTNNYAAIFPSGNVGIGTSTPTATALLDISSTTQGVRFPTLTTTQQNAISTPATGLLIWNSDSLALCSYNGSAWLKVSQGGGGSMVYPGAGIPNSTGSAWGTSYTTTGSGTVVALQTSPSLLGNVGIAQGTITSDLKALNISTTWNAAGVAFTGFKLDVTNTASAAGSKLVAVTQGAQAGFWVDKNGQGEFLSNSTLGYGVYGLKLRDYSSGSVVVLQPTATGNLYITDGGGTAIGLTLGTRLNPADGTTFIASSGRWIINSGGFVVNSSSWLRIAQNEVMSASLPQYGAFYDASNYFTAVAASTGAVTLNAVGSGASFNFSDKTLMNNVRFETSKGANVASANDLTLGTDGNVFHITGTTTINAITTANWQAGSEIILIFDSTPTVKNNTAGGGGTAVMLLAGAADFSATANDVLKLVYDGTSWFEVSRSIN